MSACSAELGEVWPTQNAPNGHNWTIFPQIRPGRPGNSVALAAASESEGLCNGALSILLNRLQVILVPETLRIDLVDVLGTRWSRGKPSRPGLDLDAAEGLIVAWRPGPDRADRFSGELAQVELLG